MIWNASLPAQKWTTGYLSGSQTQHPSTKALAKSSPGLRLRSGLATVGCSELGDVMKLDLLEDWGWLLVHALGWADIAGHCCHDLGTSGTVWFDEPPSWMRECAQTARNGVLAEWRSKSAFPF